MDIKNIAETKKRTIYESLFQSRNLLTDITLMIFSVIVLAVLSNMRISMWPVPITMQTFGVMLIAFFFGSRKGALTIILYLLAGLVGFGVFSGEKSGLGAILGPTGGYLFGFLACVFVVGMLIEKGYGRTWRSVTFCMAVGNIIIYIFGLIGLWTYLGGPAAVGIWKLLIMGLIPFLVGDVLKIVAASALFPRLWKKNQC